MFRLNRAVQYLAVGLGLLAPRISVAEAPQPAVPVDRPAPSYPASVADIEGSVTVRFKIDGDGHVRDAAIVDSNPKAVFDQTALDAVSRWLYKPRMENGRPTEQANNTIVLRFKPAPRISNRVLIYAPKPGYPADAFAAKVEGKVTVALDVTPDGTVSDARVLNSTVPGVFDTPAVNNAKAWRFEPLSDERAQASTPLVTEIDFTIAGARVAPKPIKITPPIYPNEAEAVGLMGDCSIDFMIEPDGTVKDPRIETCFPKDVFDKASLEAIKTWRFEPARGQSGPVEAPGRYAIKFRIRGAEAEGKHYLKAGEWIKLKYTLTESGHVKDVVVVDKSSPDLSERRAVFQLRNTQFSPVIENGKPVEKTDQILRIVGQ